MPLLKDSDLLFERRPGVPLDDSALDDEALDLLRFGDEGSDDDFVLSADTAADISLLHDAEVSLQELADLHNDLAPAQFDDSHPASDADLSTLDSVFPDASSVSSSVEEDRETEELQPNLLPSTVSSERGASAIATCTAASPERGATVSSERGAPVIATSTAASSERGATVSFNRGAATTAESDSTKEEMETAPLPKVQKNSTTERER